MADELRPDIQAAKNQMQAKVGAGREIKRLVEYLWEGERIELMAAGIYGPGQGLIVLSDRRLLFIKDGIGRQVTEDFPIEKISSVQWSSGMAWGNLTVFASGNKAEIKNMNKKDGKQIADAVRNRLSSSPVPAAVQPSATPAGPDVFEQLRKLGELRDAGIVTTDEFETKKRELLARL
ncbi:PH domain-containing protein [Actinosynnema sp. NPDC023587]|uniref:PH domain-containing protein n=1 Tax=Actinosynnema sp. NPDC023587 TaxID=3154695 RepID=UPI0033E57058